MGVKVISNQLNTYSIGGETYIKMEELCNSLSEIAKQIPEGQVDGYQVVTELASRWSELHGLAMQAEDGDTLKTSLPGELN